MPSRRRFPPPWSIEELNVACFVVKDAGGQKARVRLFRGRAREKIGGEVTFDGRGAADCGQYREAAGG